MARQSNQLDTIQQDYRATMEIIKKAVAKLDGLTVEADIDSNATIKHSAIELQSEIQDILSMVKDANTLANPNPYAGNKGMASVTNGNMVNALVHAEA
jgi:hypothetical protein